MLISAGNEHLGHPNRLFFLTAQSPAYYMLIHNTHHLDFKDAIKTAHISEPGFSDRHADAFLGIMHTYLLNFFNHHLRGMENLLLQEVKMDENIYYEYK